MTLTLTVEDDDYWLFKVADTGIGIDEEAQKYIFDEFRQADSGDSRTHRGTGLGLAIVKKLVDLMQGTIWVESEAGQWVNFLHPVAASTVR